MEQSSHSILRRIAFIGNYMPRQCGIATFTTDLCQSLADEYKGTACLEAHRVTGEERWQKEAHRSFEWFLGRNDLHLPVYDPTTGGCRDGLHSDRPNENQGAESTLAFLQALLELRLVENVDQPNEHRFNEQLALGSISTPQT